MRRRICYVSGTRADFGLMASTLHLLNRSPGVELGIAVTGMHLSQKYGATVSEIEAQNLPICARIPTDVDETSGAAMARSIAEAILGLTKAFQSWRPDLVSLLGDRGEMLAGAVTAVQLNIPVAHLHGGERTGTIDELMRHAISKLSHYHMVATSGARDRLIRMGEDPEHVFVTGAPGLDGIAALATRARDTLCAELGLDPARPIALVVFHPVVQEAGKAGAQVRAVLDGTVAAGAQVVALAPNADAGGDLIRDRLGQSESTQALRVVNHMPRERFVSWMACADALVGNSSSGIIEAASLGLWVVNVGSRQRLRETSGNVLDVEPDAEQIKRAVSTVLSRGRGHWRNVYGDGRAGARIAELLETVPLDSSLLMKSNAY
jgi:GDP/UDP-N,N'-diacetylbacillosamine 2-epimerase (hydrolysing)